MTDSLDAAVVTVKRWTRYGKDRAYVTQGEQQLGYRDLQTGQVVCDPPGSHDAIVAATLELWRRAEAKRYRPRHAVDPIVTTAPPPTGPTPVATVTTPPVVLLPDRDLSGNVAGEGVHARAKELRDAAPVRTRVARVFGVKNDERAWRIGGDAEQAVARRLAGLGSDWRVLHAIPVGDNGSDIDHLVVGPAGVFTVNAKHHPDAKVWLRGDTLKVNGFSTHHVRNSRHEATRAATLLSARAGFDVEVRGVVAIMGMEQGFTVVEQPRDGLVTVVQRKRVADHLRSLPAVLGRPSVERIHDVARHLATWQPTTVEWGDVV